MYEILWWAEDAFMVSPTVDSPEGCSRFVDSHGGFVCWETCVKAKDVVQAVIAGKRLLKGVEFE